MDGVAGLTTHRARQPAALGLTPATATVTTHTRPTAAGTVSATNFRNTRVMVGRAPAELHQQVTITMKMALLYCI